MGRAVVQQHGVHVVGGVDGQQRLLKILQSGDEGIAVGVFHGNRRDLIRSAGMAHHLHVGQGEGHVAGGDDFAQPYLRRALHAEAVGGVAVGIAERLVEIVRAGQVRAVDLKGQVDQRQAVDVRAGAHIQPGLVEILQGGDGVIVDAQLIRQRFHGQKLGGLNRLVLAAGHQHRVHVPHDHGQQVLRKDFAEQDRLFLPEFIQIRIFRLAGAALRRGVIAQLGIVGFPDAGLDAFGLHIFRACLQRHRHGHAVLGEADGIDEHRHHQYQTPHPPGRAPAPAPSLRHKKRRPRRIGARRAVSRNVLNHFFLHGCLTFRAESAFFFRVRRSF